MPVTRNYKKDNFYGKKHERQERFMLRMKQDIEQIQRAKAELGQVKDACPCCLEFLKEQLEVFQIAANSIQTGRNTLYEQIAPYLDAYSGRLKTYRQNHNANEIRKEMSIRWASPEEIRFAIQDWTSSIGVKSYGGFQKVGDFIWRLPVHIKQAVDASFAESRKANREWRQSQFVAASRPKTESNDGFKIECPDLESLADKLQKKDALVKRLADGRANAKVKALRRKKLLNLDELIQLLPLWLREYAENPALGDCEEQKEICSAPCLSVGI